MYHRETEQDREIQLHYWDVKETDILGEKYKFASGIVSGHPKEADTRSIQTSCIKEMHMDFEKGELLIITKNNKYHCPLEYCLWEEQDEHPDYIPEYEKIKEKYKDKIQYPSIEPGKVLIVLADFCPYYFHSAYYVPEGSKTNEPLPVSDYPHISMFQDSYLISIEDTMMDIRYFPYVQHRVEFYEEYTEGKPLYLENIGSSDIIATTSTGTIKLTPGERQLCHLN